MIYNMEIPDPFATFVAERDKDSKLPKYDYFAREWSMITACCETELFAANRKMLTKIRLYHTRNECMGGY